MKSRLATTALVAPLLLSWCGLCPLPSGMASQPENAPAPRTLSRSDQARVVDLENRIIELRQRGRYAQAGGLAVQMVAIRARAQGEAHWETGDARRLAGLCRQIAALPPAARAELAEADRADGEVLRMYAEGRAAEGKRLARSQLDIRMRWLGAEHLEVARTMNVLAELLLGEEDQAAAEPLYRQALEIERQLLGPEHPEIAATLHNLAFSLGSSGDLAGAEPLCREALAMRRRTLGGEHPDVASTLNQLASLLRLKGDREGAEPLFRQALAMRRRMLGDTHPDVATTLSQLAGLLQEQGKHAEAAMLHREALDIYRNLVGDNHPFVAATMHELGVLLAAGGDDTGAEFFFRRALALRRGGLGNRHPDVAATCRELVGVLWRDTAHTAREDRYREALKLCRELLGERDPLVGGGLTRLADLLRARGELAEAESRYRDALAWHRESTGTEHPDVVNVLDGLAAVLWQRGNLAEAEQLYRQVRLLSPPSAEQADPQVRVRLSSLARILEARDAPAAAESVYREALALWPADSDEADTNLSLVVERLAGLLLMRGEHAGAEKLYGRLVATRRKLLGRQDPRVAEALMRQAAALRARGNRAAAQELFREALALRRHAFGNQHQAVAASLQALGACLSEQGDWTSAEALFREALAVEIALRGPEDPRTAPAMDRLAGVLIRQNKLDEAERLLRQALAVYAVACDDPEDRRPADSMYHLGRVFSARGDHGGAELLYRAALGILTGETAAVASPPGSAGEHVAPAEVAACLTETLVQLNRPAEALNVAEQGRCHAVRTLLAHAAPGTPPGGASASAPAMTVNAIRAALADDELLLCYAWSSRALTALAVPGPEGGDVRGTVLAEGAARMEALRELVTNTRVALGRAPDAAARARTARCCQDLGEVLLAGLPPEIVGRLGTLRRVVVLPDGPLVEIPFAALAIPGPTPSDSHRLADRVPEVVYAVSATAFARGKTDARMPSPPAEGTPLSVVLLGDPARWEEVLGEGAGERQAERRRALRSVEHGAARVRAGQELRLHGGVLGPPAGSAQEVAAVADVVRRAGRSPAVLLGGGASVGALERAVPGAGCVHLSAPAVPGSTHHPHDASVALVQPWLPVPEDIGFLTLDRVLGNWPDRLKACRLVVLSGCDTRRGPPEGDACMSLPLAFLHAGARTVVLSLWRPHETAAALLMARFYENLLGVPEEPRARAGRTVRAGRPMPAGLALSEARRWLRGLSPAGLERARQRYGLPAGAAPQTRADGRSEQRPFADPHYWAAFVLTGQPE